MKRTDTRPQISLPGYLRHVTRLCPNSAVRLVRRRGETVRSPRILVYGERCNTAHGTHSVAGERRSERSGGVVERTYLLSFLHSTTSVLFSYTRRRRARRVAVVPALRTGALGTQGRPVPPRSSIQSSPNRKRTAVLSRLRFASFAVTLLRELTVQDCCCCVPLFLPQSRDKETETG